MTETELWNALRQGDQKSLKTIYDSQFEYMLRYGLKIVQDREVVEDSIQDVFVYIWNKRETIGSTNNIRGYLLTSLKRNLFKQQKVSSRTEAIGDNDSLYDFGAELSIDEQMISAEMDQERKKKLETAFNNLTTRQKEIIYLRYYSGLDYQDIAETMGISYQSSRNLTSSAIKAMQEIISIILLYVSVQMVSKCLITTI